MKNLEVVKLPHPTLRKKAHEVRDFGDSLQELVEDMIVTMREQDGVGLAAPQVNKSMRLIVVEYPEDDSREDADAKLFVMVNPVIVKRSEETVLGMEGCLSVPDIVGEVERAERVEVRGLNRYGKKMKVRAKGWLARVFQHEIDHLDGVLFVDKATQVWKPSDQEAMQAEQV
ncbi:MAG TPA: peptide deformylase [Anaerolineaceae bacterium]|uniref:Peptide deformylase n=1 Tax=Anaerolinea thermophila TaxID=167964 RepID=A0A117LH70_9CHLR|nr:MAG: Peptide deformylase [Anaerolinea thermophila]HAF63054.1 peptide deformylase [Anaerolineaceae bacterium]